jgi:hypothetical protein
MRAINMARKILDDTQNAYSSNMASKRFGLALAESYLKLAQLEHVTGIDTTPAEPKAETAPKKTWGQK